jgi:hypothetical protein
VKRTKEEWLTWVKDQPASAWCSPSKDKSIAVLYSGNQGRSGAWTEKDCSPESPRYRIEDTDAGKELNDASLFKKGSGFKESEAEEVWKAASARFAENIKGPVETHILSSDKNNIARSTELPIELSKTGVTTINGVDRAQLAEMAPTDAYYAICQAEIAHTKERAAQTDNPDDARTLNERAEQKETGLQAVVARDMAWNAQHSADPASAPDEGLRFSKEKEEKELKEGLRQVAPLPADLDNTPRDPAKDKGLPRDIPSPNEFSPAGPPAPAVPPPDDGIPPPATNPSVANDNSMDGP